MSDERFLPEGGGFRKLKAYQLSEAIYDLTAIFTKRFIPHNSRTTDQMVQAARSGKQNIAEGSEASSTSKKTELKLTNVAKASLAELLLDYEDYLRQHSLPAWSMDHPRAEALKGYLKSDGFMAMPTRYAAKMDAEAFCNVMITLIHQAIYLLKKLLDKQQKQFLEQGGINELMYRARIDYRNKQKDKAK